MADPELVERLAAVKILKNVPRSELEWLADHGRIEQWEAGKVFRPHDEEILMPIDPRFQSNNMVALKEAACASLGIAALPGYICRSELRDGSLQQLLPDWSAADARISALIPFRTGLLPAVRSLVDFLAVEMPVVTAFDHPRSFE